MPFIDWKDGYKVNIESFDSQHKRLISLLNALYDSFKLGKTDEGIANLFNSFMGYAMEHFSAEEAFMLKYNYPNLESHKVEHKVLIHVLKEYQSKINKDGLSMELMKVLKHWLLNHIMELDKSYGVFINERGLK
jgi:hemerythrin-like metal-binding protein